MAVSSEWRGHTPEPSPFSEVTISSTGAEAGWAARAESATPAADADGTDSTAAAAAEVPAFVGRQLGSEGQKGGAAAGQGRKVLLWGRVCLCCAAPAVKE